MTKQVIFERNRMIAILENDVARLQTVLLFWRQAGRDDQPVRRAIAQREQEIARLQKVNQREQAE